MTGPLTVAEWAAAISLKRFETPATPLTQAEMLGRFARSVMAGEGIDGFVFVVPLGVSPVADIAGSGFWLEPDPPEGVSAFAWEQMKGYLDDQALTELDG